MDPDIQSQSKHAWSWTAATLWSTLPEKRIWVAGYFSSEPLIISWSHPINSLTLALRSQDGKVLRGQVVGHTSSSSLSTTSGHSNQNWSSTDGTDSAPETSNEPALISINSKHMAYFRSCCDQRMCGLWNDHLKHTSNTIKASHTESQQYDSMNLTNKKDFNVSHHKNL